MLTGLKPEGVASMQNQIAIPGMRPNPSRPNPSAKDAQGAGHFGFEAGGLARVQLRVARRIQNIGHFALLNNKMSLNHHQLSCLRPMKMD
jgi:hypothetical protein